MNSQELKKSIEQYETQLAQVELAISVSEDGEEKDNLLSLRDDINQLLNLTKENLLTISQSTSMRKDETENKKTRDDPLADEYAMFMAELAETERCETGHSSRDGQCSTETSIIDELKAMEGMKCQAPHQHQFGETVYHNAMVCNVVPSDADQSFEDIKVRVMFTNPTHKEMLPCPYYLETDCKFSDDQCHFSHGEIVPLSSLREYKEPNFTSLKPGCRVIAKQASNKLWHRAIIRDVSVQTCTVQFEQNKSEIDLDISDVMPLESKNEGSSDDSDLSESSESEIDNSVAVEISLTNKPTSEALGNWEKYTKGIGSKLMQQMGYIIGTGLGPKSDGRIEPVEAFVLPAGKSLDHCMELKEKAGGDENLFKMERKLKQVQKRIEAQSKRAYERQKQKKDVFKFLNDTLGHSSVLSMEDKDPAKKNFSKSKHKQELKTETTRELNVKSLKIDEDIQRVKQELLKINDCLSRHSDVNSKINKNLSIQLANKQMELKNLKVCQQNVSTEQNLRKDKKKMTVF